MNLLSLICYLITGPITVASGIISGSFCYLNKRGLTEVENSKTFVPSVRGMDMPFTAGEELTRRTPRIMLPMSKS